MNIFWLIYVTVATFAVLSPKKAIIMWMTLRMLFNAQVSLRFTPPAMSLTFAVDVTLLFIYFVELSFQEKSLNKDKFIFNDIFKGLIFTYSLSLIYSTVPYGLELTKTVKYFVSNIGVLYILHKCLKSEKDLRLYFGCACLVAILITVLGIYEAVEHDNPIQDWIYFNTPHDETTKGRNYYVPPSISGSLTMRFGMVRAYSFFGIHIAFGCACVFLLYLMFSNMRHNLLKTNGFISFVVIVLLVGGVLVSNSKTPLVGIIFLFFAFYGLVTLFKPAIMIPTLLIAFAIYTYFPEYILTFTSIYDLDLADEGGGSTAELREHQMEAAWQLFLRNPLLGNGLGSLAYLRSEDDAVVEGLKGAESSIFQIMPERGIVGILVYFFMFVSLYFKCKSNIPHKELFFYLIAILSMEIVTGQLEMSLWGGMLLAVNRMFALRKMRQYG